MIDENAPENKFCRLCLEEETDLVANLFDDKSQTEDNSLSVLKERLYDLFQIKYEQSPSLPSNVCKECFHMVESFSNFRDNVHKVESELQKRLTSLKYNGNAKVIELPRRPGLNGEPGSFEPEESAVIVDVDPEHDCESSDDDFSMDSESETEEQNNVSKLSSSGPLNTTAHNSLSTDLNMTTNSEMNTENPTNTFEKNYTMESAPSNITYSCQFCDMAFSQQDECNEHVNKHDPRGPHLCSFCPMQYINRQHLITHIRVEHGCERPYICMHGECNKGFVRRSDLRKHSIVHTGVRPYTCNICGKSFSRNTNLTKHMRIHSSVRPHVCVHCPRSFSTASELLRHSRSHSTVKRKPAAQADNTSVPSLPYPNMNDQSVFHAAANNQTAPAPNTDLSYRHSILAAQLQQPRQQPAPASAPPKTSSYSRHFACEICSQTFSRERDYQRHQALHLDTLFTCKQCGMGFSRREKLARHELEQHGPQYPCNLCRISFVKPTEYEMHMKMHELQQSVALTAQAASLLSAGINTPGHPVHQQTQQIYQQPPPTKELLGMQQHQQRPSVADMTFYSQLVPTMNLGFYSETKPEDRNGI